MSTASIGGLLRRRRHGLLLSGEIITDTVVDAGTSEVFLSAATVVTGASLVLTVVARNAAGQNLANKAVTSVTLAPIGAGTVTGSGNTNAFGVATRAIEGGDVANGNTVTVVCDGVSITQVPTFDVTSAPSGTTLFVDDLFATGMFVEGIFA